jgi:hypothetical protein
VTKENRVLERQHLIFHLQVVDSETAETIGHVVDITEEGLMLMLPKPAEVDRDYRCKMILPEGRHLEFEARSRWVKPSVNPDYYDGGFCFTGISEDDERTIFELIERYKMS